MRRWLLRMVALLLLLQLAGCGAATGPSAGSSEMNAPVQRVKDFVTAAEAKDVDRMVSFLTPDERRDAAYQMRQVMPRIKTVEYRDPAYELQDNDGSTAQVRVTGRVYAETTSGEQVEQPIDQLLTLVKQDGQWYIKASEVQMPPISP